MLREESQQRSLLTQIYVFRTKKMRPCRLSRQGLVKDSFFIRSFSYFSCSRSAFNLGTLSLLFFATSVKDLGTSAIKCFDCSAAT
jgi:hypothetical protein